MTHPTKAIFKWLLSDYVKVRYVDRLIEKFHKPSTRRKSNADQIYNT